MQLAWHTLCIESHNAVQAACLAMACLTWNARASAVHMRMQPIPQALPAATHPGMALSAPHTVCAATYMPPARPPARGRRSRFTIGSADLEEQLQAALQQEAWQRQDHYDEKVDLWQVGCLVHELLCGCLPFEVSWAWLWRVARPLLLV